MQGRSGRSPVGLTLALLFVAVTIPWGDHASADVDLGTPPAMCSPNDKATGGGWIFPGGRAKRTFGFEAGVGSNAPVPGRIVFVNRPDNERLVGVIISYAPNPTNTRVMQGVGQVGRESVLFDLRVTDNAALGTPDTLSLTYTTSKGLREADGPLGGGDIQIHQTFCP